MRESKKNSGSDFIKVDAHVIQPEEYEELPEWTDEMFDEADIFIGGELVRRGRPRKTAPKKLVSLRLDPEVIHGFRRMGKGWQTRINDALKSWLDARG